MRLLHSSEVPSATRSPKVHAGLGSVSEANLREWVAKLSIPRHFTAQPENNRATGQWLATQFKQWGYQVELQGDCQNVIARPRQGSPAVTLIGAHYDSTPETPGADDNASAVAAMLGCAEVFARVGREAPVMFVAFNREEDGMLGSAEFVEKFLPGAGFKIRAAHILEMVGYASYEMNSQRQPSGLPIQIPSVGDFLGLLADQKSGAAMEAILKQARTYLPEFKVIGLEVEAGAEQVFPMLARSDHAPFWQREIPAVMWTDTAEFRNPHYHQATDTPQNLDYGFLLMVTQLLVACAAGTGEFI